MKFSRQSRLLRPDEFKQVFQKAVRSGDPYFRVLARPNGILRNRLGMAISKKTCPKAVGRNRIKRVVRENFRSKMTGKTQGQALDFVVLSTEHTANEDNKTLDESLTAHWQRLIRKANDRNGGNPPDRLRTHR